MADITVQLDCRNSWQSEAGWINVLSNEGRHYSFKYAGGSDGNGNVNVNTPNQRIIVDLAADTSYYEVIGVCLSDSRGDITSATHNATQATLRDLDRHTNYDIDYGLRIRDKTADQIFVCDPKIHNE